MIDKKLRDVDRAFIYHVMFELGIVPMDRPEMDMQRPLKDVSPEDARAMRRKFRKVWRKLMKKEIAKGNKRELSWRKDRLSKIYGVGKQSPSRSEKTARKRLVYQQVWDQVIVPMLKEFERPKRSKKDGTHDKA